MQYSTWIESALQGVKRAQLRWHRSAYAELGRGSLENGSHPARLQEPERILVFKPDEIGDAVLSLPALVTLRRHFSQSEIRVVCRSKSTPIFRASGLVDKISEVSVTTRLHRFRQVHIPPAVLKERYDLAIYLRTYPSMFGSFKRVDAKVRMHPAEPRLRSTAQIQPRVGAGPASGVHQIEQMYRLISAISGKPFSVENVEFPDFKWPEADYLTIERLMPSKRFLVVHPFAPLETRRYPFWEKVVRQFAEKSDFEIVVVGGPEDPAWEESPGVRNLVGKLSLSELGCLIQNSDGFMGNESGPMHLAGALGVPKAVIFAGHSNIEEWGPWGDSLVFHVPVTCSPCHRRVCPGFGTRCLTEIDPHRVALESLEYFTLPDVEADRSKTTASTSTFEC